MGEFRRFILSVVSLLEIFFVIAATLIGGIIGGVVPALFGGSGAGFVGFVIGGVAGFCLSGIIVNISMSLSEIAKNTQRTGDVLEQTSGKASSKRKIKNEDRDLTEEEKEEARILLESRGVRIRED